MENCPPLNVWTPDTFTHKAKVPNPNTKYYLLTLVLTIILILPIIATLAKKPKTSPQPQLLSAATSTESQNPQPSQSPQSGEEQGSWSVDQSTNQSVFYYITTSQEFLNKARTLAENNNQTPEQKQEILNTVKLALETINTGIKQSPNDDRALFQRASIYEAISPFMTNSLALAIQDLNSAIRSNSGNPAYYQKLAGIYSKGGDLTRAASTLYNVYLLNPTDVQTVYTLADTLEKTGDLSKANYYFQKLISLLPQNDVNLTNVRLRQEQLAQKIQSDNLTYITEPGAAAVPNSPLPSDSSTPAEPPFGLEELPMEQASLASNVIIAGENDNIPANSESQTNVNGLHGTTIIPAGQTEVTVSSDKVTDNSFISLKPQTSTKNRIVSVSEKQAGSHFKISLDSATDIEIKVEWWITE